MEIILKRIAKRATYTIGRLYILPDGSVERELIPGRRRDDKRTVRCRVDESLLTTEHYFCDTLSLHGATCWAFRLPRGRWMFATAGCRARWPARCRARRLSPKALTPWW